MRIGILEIIIIILVIIALVIIARVSRVKKDTSQQTSESQTEISHWEAKEKAGKLRRNLQKIGIAAIGSGVILALAGVSLLRWALQSYIWAFIIVAIGLVFILLSHKK